MAAPTVLEARPSGVAGRVLAMARPRRSHYEAEAVRAMAAQLAPRLSCRRKADELARRVVAAWMADQARTEPFERALFDAQQLIAPDLAHALAVAPESGLAEWFTRQRVARFEARGCTQIGAEEWAAETRELAAGAQLRLARRFRALL